MPRLPEGESLDEVTTRYAIGGFFSGLLAGGAMVALFHLLMGGELMLPALLAAGGAGGAWLTFR